MGFIADAEKSNAERVEVIVAEIQKAGLGRLVDELLAIKAAPYDAYMTRTPLVNHATAGQSQSNLELTP